MDALAVDPAGQVVLRGHGVEVAGEQHRRAAAHQQAVVAEVVRPDQAAHVRRQPRLVARLGRDVDELERAGREPLGRPAHAAARRSSSDRTSGATSVPNRSIDRITSRWAISPADICAR